MSPEDTAAFRAVLRATADDLLGYFERRVCDREDAADMLAETMLQAWRRASALPQEAERQRMWLFTVAAHVLANYRRSARRRSALVGRIRQHLEEGHVADPSQASAVRDAVRRLNDGHRELVMLIHWDGFSITEAAALLNINPSTARSRYSSCREQLRQALLDPVP